MDCSRSQYPSDRDSDVADRFTILAVQDRRSNGGISPVLLVRLQETLLQAHQAYRTKKEREELLEMIKDSKN